MYLWHVSVSITVSASVADKQKSRKQRQKKQLANRMKCFNVLTVKMPGNVALISQQSRKRKHHQQQQQQQHGTTRTRTRRTNVSTTADAVYVPTINQAKLYRCPILMSTSTRDARDTLQMS